MEGKGLSMSFWPASLPIGIEAGQVEVMMNNQRG